MGLQGLVEATHRRAIQINCSGSDRDKKVSGFIHDWVRYEYDENFKNNANRILSVFESALAPYIEGLKSQEFGGSLVIGPALMGYVAQEGNVKYSLIFRISDRSTYLIASPELECTLPESSAIRPALSGIDPSHTYEKILDYIFRRKEVDRKDVENVEVGPGKYLFALKPVLAGDIPGAAAEMSEAAKKLDGYSEVVHQAAALISFAGEGSEKVRELEERLGVHQLATHTRELHQDRLYAQAKKSLNQVKIGGTPILNRYFV